jgi:multidrug efflux pump subunit AcrB
VSSANVNLPLKQVAKVTGAGNRFAICFIRIWPGRYHKHHPSAYPAVTLSIAKRKGADAMRLSEHILAKVENAKKQLIPADVQTSITRNYGETASHKVSELLFHLFISIVVVTLFVMLAMGWRGGLVVFLSVPVTFALTLLAYYFLGYTLNRITLFGSSRSGSLRSR